MKIKFWIFIQHSETKLRLVVVKVKIKPDSEEIGTVEGLFSNASTIDFECMYANIALLSSNHHYNQILQMSV